jgi:hypothetical protein
MAVAAQKPLFPPLRIDLNIALWIAQALGAISLGRSGVMLLETPAPEVAAELGEWVMATSPSTIQLVGLLHLVASFALWGPSLLRIAPRVSVITAAALALVLLVSSLVHGLQGELRPLVSNFTLAPAMAFIAWGRFFKSPIQPHAMLK